MMKRAVLAPTVRSSMLAARRAHHVPMSQPLGQGKVVPLKFNYARPAYLVPSFGKQFHSHFWWIQTHNWPNLIVCGCIVFAVHGGFTGHLPPDPHSLWG